MGWSLGSAPSTSKVLENIRYGVPDASEEDVLRAMREADLYDDAWKLPIPETTLNPKPETQNPFESKGRPSPLPRTS